MFKNNNTTIEEEEKLPQNNTATIGEPSEDSIHAPQQKNAAAGGSSAAPARNTAKASSSTITKYTPYSLTEEELQRGKDLQQAISEETEAYKNFSPYSYKQSDFDADAPNNPLLQLARSYQPPKPALTPQQENAARMASALGDSLAMIAELFASGRGAYIRDRDPNTNQKTTNEKIKEYQDKFNADKNKYDSMQADLNMRGLDFFINRKSREDEAQRQKLAFGLDAANKNYDRYLAEMADKKGEYSKTHEYNYRADRDKKEDAYRWSALKSNKNTPKEYEIFEIAPYKDRPSQELLRYKLDIPARKRLYGNAIKLSNEDEQFKDLIAYEVKTQNPNLNNNIDSDLTKYLSDDKIIQLYMQYQELQGNYYESNYNLDSKQPEPDTSKPNYFGSTGMGSQNSEYGFNINR
ncbi:MAG: hypothetical protein LBB53_05745 [Prevotellaceae bacterium]|jgi:hypothetical protein|nr:hypothetical protein [Prevotellaceae bacterium]